MHFPPLPFASRMLPSKGEQQPDPLQLPSSPALNSIHTFGASEEVRLCAHESPKSNLRLTNTTDQKDQLPWQAELSFRAVANGLQLSSFNTKLLQGSLTW